jgi:hypothetical protein
MLSVEAAAPVELTYQWFLNKVPVEGAVNPTLVVTNVQSSQMGDYFVTVTAGALSSNSEKATLSLGNPSPPKLDQAAIDPSGMLRLGISGQPGEVLEVQTSSDLDQWIPLKSVTNTTGTVVLSDPDAPSIAHRFYRVVVKP